MTKKHRQRLRRSTPALMRSSSLPVVRASECPCWKLAPAELMLLPPELREAGGEDSIYTPPTLEGIHDGILKSLPSGRPKTLNRTDYS
jgi:hypothetical protein